ARLNFFIRRDRRRAALLRWMMPWLTAVSSAFCARMMASSDESTSAEMASVARAMNVFTEDLVARLRSVLRRISFARRSAFLPFPLGIQQQTIAAAAAYCPTTIVPWKG